ncbi:hypothetical protein BC567DRAFT_6175 [Phyllosticta citribraziliensis]
MSAMKLDSRRKRHLPSGCVYRVRGAEQKRRGAIQGLPIHCIALCPSIKPDSTTTRDGHAKHHLSCFLAAAIPTSQVMMMAMTIEDGHQKTRRKERKEKIHDHGLLRRAATQPLPPLAASHSLFSNRSLPSPFPLLALTRSTIHHASSTESARPHTADGFLHPASKPASP